MGCIRRMRGDLPLIDDDPTQPERGVFRHIDAVVEMAAALGLYIGHAADLGR